MIVISNDFQYRTV